jgi:two-component system nitrate/nitrite response regulator NarL
MTRILIADPDPRIRQALILLLERKLGAVQADEAWDRAALERQLAALRPDVLLLDCHLPGLTTADITALLSRPISPRLALMSVDADDLPTALGFNAAFIYKGAPPAEVLATLRGLIPA